MQINLTLGDIHRICEYLKIPVDELFAKYVGLKPFGDPVTGGYEIDIGIHTPCVFRKTNKCRIYDSRPLNCRLFPFWILAKAPEEKLKDLLKGRCEYDYNDANLEKWREYFSIISEVLLKEAEYYVIGERIKTKEINEKADVETIKEKIEEHIDEIKKNQERIKETEKLLKE